VVHGKKDGAVRGMRPKAFAASDLAFNGRNFGENFRLKMNVFYFLNDRQQAHRANQARERMLGEPAGCPGRKLTREDRSSPARIFNCLLA
jgi:hypothetical protein